MAEPLHLFDATGVELEYMIVDRESLDVRPICDVVLGAVGDGWEREVERGETAWSNELALHVIETKCNGPVRALAPLDTAFAGDIAAIGALLEPHGAMLMPGAMHPWMDPLRETRLWPHEDDQIYRAFDRIFGCSGHGWSNLQSVHINLPFCGDDEFDRLHQAIRALLPLMPALSASSPVVEGQVTGWLDNRLRYYRGNARAVPSVSGRVVPDVHRDRAAYESMLRGIYRDLAPHDPDGILADEWVNARGAIARFDRMAIEIRALDIGEHPGVDLAVVAAISAVVRGLALGELGDVERAAAIPTEALSDLLDAVARDGERALIEDTTLLAALGLPARPQTAQQAWSRLVDATADAHAGAPWRGALDVILRDGPLARRLLGRLGSAPTREAIAEVWRELCACLQHGRAFAA